jgi:hypothetical protein
LIRHKPPGWFLPPGGLDETIDLMKKALLTSNNLDTYDIGVCVALVPRVLAVVALLATACRSPVSPCRSSVSVANS